MTWKPEVEQMERRRAAARELGGAQAVEEQHARGRLTVRERIERLADPDSFREQGPLAGHAELDADGELTSFSPANYVLGFAKVDGRPVVIGGEDFTQRGGSPSPAGLRKSVYSEDLACRYRLPLIRLLEGGGGSVAGTAGRAKPAPEPAFGNHRFLSIARALRTAPVCSAALGAVAGFPAARLAASHFSVMTRTTSQVLIGGPALVERATGEKRTKDELCGAKVPVYRGAERPLVRSAEYATFFHGEDGLGDVGYVPAGKWPAKIPQATVRQYDALSDLAILYLATPLSSWGHLQLHREPRVGDRVTIGGRRETWIKDTASWMRNVDDGIARRYLETTATAPGGTSGAPLCDASGAVVGLCIGHALDESAHGHYTPASSVAGALREAARL